MTLPTPWDTGECQYLQQLDRLATDHRHDQERRGHDEGQQRGRS
jgi:hypothetical protein